MRVGQDPGQLRKSALRTHHLANACTIVTVSVRDHLRNGEESIVLLLLRLRCQVADQLRKNCLLLVDGLTGDAHHLRWRLLEEV